jgi:hypothetical protein
MKGSGRGSGKPRQTSVRIAGLRAEIRNRDLPTTKPSAKSSAVALGDVCMDG